LEISWENQKKSKKKNQSQNQNQNQKIKNQIKKSKHFLFSDHLINSHNHFS